MITIGPVVDPDGVIVELDAFSVILAFRVAFTEEVITIIFIDFWLKRKEVIVIPTK